MGDSKIEYAQEELSRLVSEGWKIITASGTDKETGFVILQKEKVF